MREKINRLARGVLNEEQPVLSVSPERIDMTLRRGEVLKVPVQADSLNSVHLKGLAWSESIRVRVLRSSFGGKRNQIVLEADGRHLGAGDRIEGKLVLVTNGGERIVPFLFTVTDGAAGTTLSSLKTIEDFALIAKAEPESALRIFEYRNFVSAPFMQDLKLRSLYNAFRMGPDRASAMEEFLVASGAKKPALVRNETGRCEIVCTDGSEEGRIVLVRAREGYFSLAVRADGAFLKLEKRSVSASEFIGSSFTYLFRIDPSRLHEGRNEGKISFYSQTSEFSVPVTVWRQGESSDASARKQETERKKHYAEYVSLRAQYELTGRSDTSLPGLMIRELKAAGEGTEQNTELLLLEAEASMFAGQTDRCRELLESVGDAVRENRQHGIYEYLLYEAVRALLPEREEKRESTMLLLRKYLEEAKMYTLLPRYLFFRPELLKRDPSSLKLFLHEEYLNGNRSPYLYAAFAQLYEQYPDLISGLGEEELAVLRYSLSRGLPGKAAAAAYTQRAGELRNYTDLHCRLLAELYDKEPSAELLTAVCRSLIRRDQRTEAAHLWYLKGISADIRLTGLCEYVIYSMPKEQKTALPREILLYFAYDNRLDDRSRAALYENICRFRKKEQTLWEEYRKQLLPFTLEQLLKGRVNRHLAVLYQEVLCKEIIDRRLAAVLPAVLNARRIRTDSDAVRSVVMISPRLKEEEKYLLDKKTAYVPVQAEDAVFLFEDSYGNRFADVAWKEEQVCSMPELLEYCEELVPDGPWQILKRLDRIAAGAETMPGGRLPAGEVRTVINAIEEGRLSESFTEQLLTVLLDHPEDSLTYLAGCPDDMFRPDQRSKLLKVLIDGGQTARAWEVMEEYMPGNLGTEHLKKLCSRMILEELFPEDPMLLKLSARVFREGGADPVILDYLCERFNGGEDEMYRLLKASTGSGCQTEELEERLTGQMLFTGKTQRLKVLFARLRERSNAPEMLLRACITEFSAEYVLNDKEPGKEIFLYLETLAGAAADRNRIPVIYRLALIRYYASLNTLGEQQKELAEQILPGLLDEGLSFPYYKNLAQFIPVPQEVLDKECVMFRGDRDGSYEIRMRILPEETEFRTEQLRNMFLDLFVRQEILFAGESWEYEIRETGSSEVLQRGEIRSSEENSGTEKDGVKQHSRFACLNSMTKSLARKDEKTLRAEMESFAAEEDLAAELFGL